MVLMEAQKHVMLKEFALQELEFSKFFVFLNSEF